MEKRDDRGLSHAVREEIRKREVGWALAEEGVELLIENLGFYRSCIYDWHEQYRRRGEGGLERKPIPGRPRKYDDGQWEDERELNFSNLGTIALHGNRPTGECRKLRQLSAALAGYAARPIYRILEVHPVHRSKKGLNFVETRDDKLNLFFLRPYLSELNSEEMV